MSAVVSMNEETRRMEQFNDIMATVKPLMTSGKGKNIKMITGSTVVPLSCCFVDSRYQGMRTHKHLNRLKNKWDERKLTPIILVPHPEEYRFAVVDGQGRCLVAPEKGMDRLNRRIERKGTAISSWIRAYIPPLQTGRAAEVKERQKHICMLDGGFVRGVDAG